MNFLTTGRSSVALGPNGAGNSSLTTAIPVTGDVDLALLTGLTVENASILEFDFVATGLILNFDYVLLPRNILNIVLPSLMTYLVSF
ncbi:MAG: choice-of-anchor L domain-containing protein [Flavobacterium sp.]|nr:choice-of-anchor L domain-containing protein [Flavobacterium sp.]